MKISRVLILEINLTKPYDLAVDPIANPYTPNAGATPSALVGRDDQLQSFDVLLGRLQKGFTEQSMIITGLRGVGKTVLLNAFGIKAEQQRWQVVELEAPRRDTDADFRLRLAQKFRQALLGISAPERWRDRMRRAVGVLRSFSLSVDQAGTVTAGIDTERVLGQADTGDLGLDLTDMLVALGEAAREEKTGVVLLVDEVQFLTAGQLESLIMALHKTVQRALPVTMVAAGLPQIAELTGEAKSYAERLFKFPKIDHLGDADARRALAEPARPAGARYQPAALDRCLEITDGYPYFLQELGYAIWPIAHDGTITPADVERAEHAYTEKLDGSFFRVRFDRATVLERAYMRAMAELGPEPHAAGDVARLLNRTSAQCAPVRATLIQKGLLYTVDYGYAQFTVPHFDRFMRRAAPELVVPEIRQRARGREDA